MLKLRTLIFGTFMHQYWGYPWGRNYASVSNILKVTIFFKISHFALFSSFDIYAKDTKFINGTSYTNRHMHTETHTDRYRYHFYILHFLSLIWHTCRGYKFYIWHTTDLHMHRHSDMHTHGTHMYRDIDTQIQIHTDTCMFVYIHKQIHTLICNWEI